MLRTYEGCQNWKKNFQCFRETHVVLLAELLGERGAHDDTALVRGSLEVSGTALASGRRDLCRDVRNENRSINGVDETHEG